MFLGWRRSFDRLRTGSWLRWMLGALAVVTTVACRGDDGYVTIERQGGAITAEGATLAIAPEVLSSPVQFKISRDDLAKLPPVDGSSGQIVQSDSFHFQSRGGGGMPATVSIPLKSPLLGETPLEVYQLSEGNWVWLTAASVHPDGSAIAAIPSLPATVVVVRPPPAPLQISLRWSFQAPPPGGALQTATQLHPLGYQVAPDGSLVLGSGPTLTPDIRPFLPPGGHRVVPVVQNSAASTFDGGLIAAILTDPERRQYHVDRLVALVEEGDYAGVELDYRGLDLSLRETFATFVTELAQAFHGGGRPLYVDVPLPYRGGGGWNDGAYDWRQLGAVVDALVIRPPNDLSFYSARMGEIVRYAITQVQRSKLRLGVNTASHEKTPGGVRDISRSQALELAAQIKVEGNPRLISGEVVALLAPLLTSEQGRLGFSQEANALAFDYAAGGERRSVWIENAHSLAAKLELAQQYQLGGVYLEGDFGGADDARLWQVLLSYRDKRQVEAPPGEKLPLPLWQSSDGSLREQGQARVSWRLPPPGSYTLTLCLSDGTAQGCQRLPLEVGAPPSPTATPRSSVTSTPTPISASIQASIEGPEVRP